MQYLKPVYRRAAVALSVTVALGLPQPRAQQVTEDKASTRSERRSAASSRARTDRKQACGSSRKRPTCRPGWSKIVVTDDQGRYVVPDLPEANYSVWVRGFGLVDSPKVQARPGRRLDLTPRRPRRTRPRRRNTIPPIFGTPC